jgi:hypothetical protein
MCMTKGIVNIHYQETTVVISSICVNVNLEPQLNKEHPKFNLAD